MNVWCETKACRWVMVGLLILALPMLAGCGDSKGTVSGKVTYNGKVVKGGSVTFIPADGTGVVSGQIGTDGTYTIEDVKEGEATITVETDSAKPAPNPPGAPGGRGGAPPGRGGTIPKDAPSGLYGPGGGKSAANYVRIPENYAAPDESGLKYTVKSGKQTHNIELK